MKFKKKKKDFLNSIPVFHLFMPHSSMFVQGTKDTKINEMIF